MTKMFDFMGEHPWLTFFLAVIIVGGLSDMVSDIFHAGACNQ